MAAADGPAPPRGGRPEAVWVRVVLPAVLLLNASTDLGPLLRGALPPWYAALLVGGALLGLVAAGLLVAERRRDGRPRGWSSCAGWAGFGLAAAGIGLHSLMGSGASGLDSVLDLGILAVGAGALVHAVRLVWRLPRSDLTPGPQAPR